MNQILKLIGRLGFIFGIILSVSTGLNALTYIWLLPLIAFQTLSYYLFHFKNFKFKKIGKRNNPFIKELPHHLIVQSLIVLICFGVGLVLDNFFEHDAYNLFLGIITHTLNVIGLALNAIKQAMIELCNAILQSRFN